MDNTRILGKNLELHYGKSLMEHSRRRQLSGTITQKNRWESWEQIKKGRLWENKWECTFRTLCFCSVTL